MTTNTTLFPDQNERATLNKNLDQYIDASLTTIGKGTITPRENLTNFRKTLSAMQFQAPQNLDNLLQWTLNTLETGAVQMTHKGYLGLFNPAPSYPSEAADRIVSALNPQNCVWSHAPVAVEIEAHLITQICDRIGLPKGSVGHFTSGGSEANATAFLCALTRANENYAEHGARAFRGQPRIYISKESHLAWLKIAHQNGVGRQAIRLVPTDGHGCMSATALKTIIEKDTAQGDIPVMIAATAGTTNAGMVDPLHACADIAKTSKLWYHVDAAWGGALIASARERHVLDGIERADSVTIDAHKWFASTMGTGMFFTAHPETLTKTFRVETSYMPSNDEDVDLYVNSMMWSRRFLGLRLFLSLASVGWEGYAQHVEHGINLIDYLNTQMHKHGWTIANNSRMAVTCLIPPKHIGSAEDMVKKIVASGTHWVSLTKIEGQPVLRACITNGRTQKADIDALIAQCIA